VTTDHEVPVAQEWFVHQRVVDGPTLVTEPGSSLLLQTQGTELRRRRDEDHDDRARASRQCTSAAMGDRRT